VPIYKRNEIMSKTDTAQQVREALATHANKLRIGGHTDWQPDMFYNARRLREIFDGPSQLSALSALKADLNLKTAPRYKETVGDMIAEVAQAPRAEVLHVKAANDTGASELW